MSKHLPKATVDRVIVWLPILSAVFLAGSVGHSGLTTRLATFLSGAQAPVARPAGISVGRWLWPGAFEVRSTDPHVQTPFVASGRRYIARVRSDGFEVRRGTQDAHAIDIRFAGAKAGGAADLSGKADATLSLFGGQADGGSASLWQRFSASTFHDIYPGIDARFHVNDGDLELDFLLQPGSDPASIQLVAASSTRLAVDAPSGDIIVTHDDEHFRLPRPRAFQPAASGRAEIEVRTITDGRSLHFVLPSLDHALPV